MKIPWYVEVRFPVFVMAEDSNGAIKVVLDEHEEIIKDCLHHGLLSKVSAVPADESHIKINTGIQHDYIPYGSDDDKTIGELVGDFIQVNGSWYKKVQ